jgi:predicted nucleic acid-binding protein
VILADTGGLLAAFNPADGSHRRCVAFIQSLRRPLELVVPAPVVVELAQLIEVRMGPLAEARALRRVVTARWPVQEAADADLLRAADLVEQYASFPLGTVDALIIAMAERLEITTIFTLDRRRFGAVRPAHCERFEIVPDLD